MKFLREHAIVLMLALVALTLFFFTLRLQGLVRSAGLAANEPAPGPLRLLREQLAALIAPETLTPTPSPTWTPLPPTPTWTVEPPTATATPTMLLPSPTATLLLPTPTQEHESAAEVLLPTATALPAATATPVPAEPPPTSAPSPTPPAEQTVPADYTLGALAGRPGCQLVTAITALVLAERFDLRIAQRTFNTADDLYTALAHAGEPAGWVDFTFCTLFPDDGDYFAQFGSQLKLLGSDYARQEGQRWYLVAFSGHFIDLRTNRSCLYRFFTDQMDFGDLQFAESEAAAWLANHADQVALWTACTASGS